MTPFANLYTRSDIRKKMVLLRGMQPHVHVESGLRDYLNLVRTDTCCQLTVPLGNSSLGEVCCPLLGLFEGVVHLQRRGVELHMIEWVLNKADCGRDH